MAEESAHLQIANRNQASLRSLLGDLSLHAPWVATIAFYKALHVVEGVFANDADIRHRWDHGNRLNTLKTTSKYRQIFIHYSPLYRLSLVARYLQQDIDSSAVVPIFEKYIAYDKLVSIFLLHHLHQLEVSAAKFLATPGALNRVVDLRTEALESAARAMSLNS